MEKHKHMSKEEISKEVRASLQRYLVDLIRAVVSIRIYLFGGETDTLPRSRCSGRNQTDSVGSSSYQH